MSSKLTDRKRVERAARLYGTNQDAAAALGIAAQSFGRLCRRYGIETPWARHRLLRQAARMTALANPDGRTPRIRDDA